MSSAIWDLSRYTKDIGWVEITDRSVPIARLLTAGKIDAFLAIPPETQELRAQNVGHGS